MSNELEDGTIRSLCFLQKTIFEGHLLVWVFILNDSRIIVNNFFCCTVSVFVEIVFISKGAAWHALIFRSTPEIQSDETMPAVPHS